MEVQKKNDPASLTNNCHGEKSKGGIIKRLKEIKRPLGKVNQTSYTYFFKLKSERKLGDIKELLLVLLDVIFEILIC